MGESNKDIPLKKNTFKDPTKIYRMFYIDILIFLLLNAIYF